MAAFDNLVARKGSATQSYGSGSTNPATSNVSETRDISRQSEQRARQEHHRAIRLRKVAFLVLILLLILGGLSYAIYKVVSNESEPSESKKVKLEQDESRSKTVLWPSSSLETSQRRTSSGIIDFYIFQVKLLIW